MSVRLSWDEYFMELARYVATRSTCITAQVGAVIVRDRQVLSSGYNGAPSGLPHCNEQGYCYPGLAQCGKGLGLPSIAVHAEINAIAQSARVGTPIQGAIIYVTAEPCLDCLKALIAAGIRVVFCGDAVRNDKKDCIVRDMFINAGLVDLVRV